VFQNRNIVRFDGYVVSDMETIVTTVDPTQLNVGKRLPLTNGDNISHILTTTSDRCGWHTQVSDNLKLIYK
jgi:hypothetical protein